MKISVSWLPGVPESVSQVRSPSAPLALVSVTVTGSAGRAASFTVQVAVPPSGTARVDGDSVIARSLSPSYTATSAYTPA